MPMELTPMPMVLMLLLFPLDPALVLTPSPRDLTLSPRELLSPPMATTLARDLLMLMLITDMLMELTPMPMVLMPMVLTPTPDSSMESESKNIVQIDGLSAADREIQCHQC